MPHIPPPAQAARITSFLRDHPRWSVFWDKRYGLWRAAEDDPDSDLYAEAGNADTGIQYMSAHSGDTSYLSVRGQFLSPVTTGGGA
jgi:hypothetical protein